MNTEMYMEQNGDWQDDKWVLLEEWRVYLGSDLGSVLFAQGNSIDEAYTNALIKFNQMNASLLEEYGRMLRANSPHGKAMKRVAESLDCISNTPNQECYIRKV